MMRILINLLFLTFSCLLISVSMKKVAPQQFIESYKKNTSLIKDNTSRNGVSYSIKYIPKELRIIQLHKKGLISLLEAEKQLKEDKEFYDFILEININSTKNFLQNESDTLSFTERTKYFSFEFENDINVRIGDHDMININNYIFERNFSLSPKGIILFSIPKKEKENYFTIVLFDKVYGQEELNFRFNIKDIKSLPKLKKVKKWKK